MKTPLNVGCEGLSGGWVGIYDVDDRYVSCVEADELGDHEAEIAAGQIVFAVNAHDALVAALNDALAHVTELEGAWLRGAVNSIDGNNAERSNRNHAVRVTLSAALASATA